MARVDDVAPAGDVVLSSEITGFGVLEIGAVVWDVRVRYGRTTRG